MEVVSFDSNGYMQLDGKMSPETYSKLSQGVAGRKGGCFGYNYLLRGSEYFFMISPMSLYRPEYTPEPYSNH